MCFFSSFYMLGQLLAGVEAGVVLVFIFNPLWLVKTRLALQGADPHSLTPATHKGAPQYKGIIGK